MQIDSLRTDLQSVADKYHLSDFLFVFCEDPQADPVTITVNKKATNRAAEIFRQVRRWIIIEIKNGMK